MLQVTESAANVFRKILDQQALEADGVRIVPSAQPDGQMGIGLQAIDEPSPTDQAVEVPSKDVLVVVAPELAPQLDDAILDARETDEGADLFLRMQEDEG